MNAGPARAGFPSEPTRPHLRSCSRRYGSVEGCSLGLRRSPISGDRTGLSRSCAGSRGWAASGSWGGMARSHRGISRFLIADRGLLAVVVGVGTGFFGGLILVSRGAALYIVGVYGVRILEPRALAIAVFLVVLAVATIPVGADQMVAIELWRLLRLLLAAAHAARHYLASSASGDIPEHWPRRARCDKSATSTEPVSGLRRAARRPSSSGELSARWPRG